MAKNKDSKKATGPTKEELEAFLAQKESELQDLQLRNAEIDYILPYLQQTLADPRNINKDGDVVVTLGDKSSMIIPHSSVNRQDVIRDFINQHLAEKRENVRKTSVINKEILPKNIQRVFADTVLERETAIRNKQAATAEQTAKAKDSMLKSLIEANQIKSGMGSYSNKEAQKIKFPLRDFQKVDPSFKPLSGIIPDDDDLAGAVTASEEFSLADYFDYKKQSGDPAFNIAPYRLPFQEEKKRRDRLRELEQTVSNDRRYIKDILSGRNPVKESEKIMEDSRTSQQEFFEKAKEEEGKTLPDGTSYSFQGTPRWFGGPYGSLKWLEERARAESQMPYQPYEGQRVAGPSTLQDMAEEEAYKTMQDEQYRRLFERSRDNLGEATETNAYENIDRYMNPYEEKVLDKLQNRMNRNLKENILPNIGANFISRGMANSGVRQTAQEKALRDMQEAYAEEAGSLMARGYEGAINTQQADLARRMQGAQSMQNLKSQEMEDMLNNVNIMDKLGTRERATRQAELDAAYQDFLQQQNYTPRQTGRYMEIIRGISPSMNTESYANAPVQPQPSPYTQAAGMGMQFMDMMQPRSRYAIGGSVLPEEDDYNQRLQAAIGMFDRSGRDPMWSYLGRTGAALAASKNPNMMGALGEASAQGYDAFTQAREAEEQRPLQALSFSKLLADSQRSSEERLYRRSLEKEQLEMARLAASQPKIKDEWRIDELGNPVIARKVNNLIEEINGQPVVSGRVVQGGSLQQAPGTVMSASGNPMTPIEQRKRIELSVGEEGEANKAEKKDIQAVTDGLNAIKTMKQLSEELPMPVWNKFHEYAGAAKNLIGEEHETLAKMQTYKGLISQTLPGMLQVLRGLGSMSQIEFNAATGMLADANLQPSARENLLSALESKLEQLKSKVNAREAYMKLHGSDNGFEQQWLNYVHTHPAATLNEKSGKFEVHHHNIDNWRDMFGKDAELFEKPTPRGQLKTKEGTFDIEELRNLARKK